MPETEYKRLGCACNKPNIQLPNHPCLDCGVMVWSASVRCKPCNYGRSKRADMQCKGCGKTFNRPARGKDAMLYCSRECAYAHSSQWVRTNPDKPGPRSLVYFNTCKQCGKQWTARRKNTLCSDECAKALACSKDRCRGVANKALRGRSCKCCGAQFTPEYGDKRTSFCSIVCSTRLGRRIGKAKRKALERGVEADNIDPFKVFDRDGWRCQICGKATPRARRGTIHSNAPELDHRVPTTRGGGHVYSNVQCACRQCNGEKSNRSNKGQLPMFDITL